MIKFALRCGNHHDFESWFRSGAAFDALQRAGELECPACGSRAVEKSVMAPAVARGDRAIAAPVPALRPEAQPVAMMGSGERELRDMVRALHRKIAESSEHVGPAFSDEARRIHAGEAPQRAIHGEASGEDVRGLIEDGVPFMPIPPLPDDHH